MPSPNTCDIAVIGAGIMGLAHAYVAVFERSPRATGASIRNFGRLSPIGQPHGEMLQLALRSREIWRDLLHQARLPYRPDGSLHVIYRDDEAAVAQEFAELAPSYAYRCQWLDRRRNSRIRSLAHSRPRLADVRIVTSPGGSGMTLSFGIGERTLAELEP